MLDVYAVRDDTIINANHNFGGGSSMTSWADATGSWANGGDGVVYDGDSEANPLTQTVTLGAGWHDISIVAGGMSDGTYIVRVFRLSNQDTVAETSAYTGSGEQNERFEAVSGDYQIALYATNDADGSVENVILTTTELRIPDATDERFSLNYDEQLLNPVFYVDNGGWEDSTNSWSNSNNLAVYDNDGQANTLHQDDIVIATAGWSRLGIEAAAGSTITNLFARVQGVTPSLITWHNGEREKFFYLAAATYQVDVWAAGITSGGVKLVSLMSVERVSGKKRKSRTITDTDYLTPADEVVLVDPTGGDIYVNLPPLAVSTEAEIFIKRITGGGNAVTVDGNASETIDGSTTYSMSSNGDAVRLVAVSGGWVKM